MTIKLKIKIVGDCVGTYVNLRHIPKIYKELSPEPINGVYTLELEAAGEDLMKENFANPKNVYSFFLEVMKWSGPTGNRLCKKDRENEIVDAIIEAGNALKENDIKSAITTMTNLKGFEIATGSLVLHALSPQQVGAYDSIQAKHWGYSNDAAGLVEFCNDCKAVATTLNNLGIKNPKREQTDGKWLIADIDSVFFHLMFKK